MKLSRYNPASRFITLDMRGKLVIDVQGAIKAGVFDRQIEGARRLARALEIKREANRPIPYVLTPAGRAHLEGK